MIHEKACVAKDATLGANVKVWQFATIMPYVVLGDGVSVGSNAEIGTGSVIGDYSRIGHGVFLPPHSKIGREVFIGPSVTCCDDKYPRVNNAAYNAEPPVIEDGASIGAGVVLLPGVRIGSGAMIGAGAIVTRDVPEKAVVFGNPARSQKVA